MNIKLLKAQSILQEALQEALFDLEDNRIKNIAVTRVECTQGKELARVFLDKNSLGDMEATNALKLLKKASGAIRANLQAQLSWYKMPNLVFEIDDSLEKINKLESIFKKIHSKERNSSLGKGNSPLELHSADLADFGHSQTPSLASRPKSAKNYESQTENPSVVDSLHESKDKKTPSLREARSDSWQSTQNPNANSSIVSEKSGLCSHERGNKTKASIDEASGKLHDLSPQDEFATRN